MFRYSRIFQLVILLILLLCFTNIIKTSIELVEPNSTTLFDNSIGDNFENPEEYPISPTLDFANAFRVFKILESSTEIRVITIDTCGSSFDTVLAVFTTTPLFHSLNLLKYNDDRSLHLEQCTPTTSYLKDIIILPHSELIIFVGGYIQPGPYTISKGEGILSITLQGTFPSSLFPHLDLAEDVLSLRENVLQSLDDFHVDFFNSLEEEFIPEILDRFNHLNKQKRDFLPGQLIENILEIAENTQSQLEENQNYISSLENNFQNFENNLQLIISNLNSLNDEISNNNFNLLILDTKIEDGKNNFLQILQILLLNSNLSSNEENLLQTSLHSLNDLFLSNLDIVINSLLAEMNFQIKITQNKTILLENGVQNSSQLLDQLNDHFTQLENEINNFFISFNETIEKLSLNIDQSKDNYLEINSQTDDRFSSKLTEMNLNTLNHFLSVNEVTNDLKERIAEKIEISSSNSFSQISDQLNDLGKTIVSIEKEVKETFSLLHSFDTNLDEELFINDIITFLPDLSIENPPIYLRIPNSFGGRMDDVATYLQSQFLLLNNNNNNNYNDNNNEGGDEFIKYMDYYYTFISENKFRNGYLSLQNAFNSLYQLPNNNYLSSSSSSSNRSFTTLQKMQVPWCFNRNWCNSSAEYYCETFMRYHCAQCNQNCEKEITGHRSAPLTIAQPRKVHRGTNDTPFHYNDFSGASPQLFFEDELAGDFIGEISELTLKEIEEKLLFSTPIQPIPSIINQNNHYQTPNLSSHLNMDNNNNSNIFPQSFADNKVNINNINYNINNDINNKNNDNINNNINNNNDNNNDNKDFIVSIELTSTDKCPINNRMTTGQVPKCRLFPVINGNSIIPPTNILFNENDSIRPVFVELVDGENLAYKNNDNNNNNNNNNNDFVELITTDSTTNKLKWYLIFIKIVPTIQKQKQPKITFVTLNKNNNNVEERTITAVTWNQISKGATKEIATSKIITLPHSINNPLYIFIHTGNNDHFQYENLKQRTKNVQCIPNFQIRHGKRIPKKIDFRFIHIDHHQNNSNVVCHEQVNVLRTTENREKKSKITQNQTNNAPAAPSSNEEYQQIQLTFLVANLRSFINVETTFFTNLKGENKEKPYENLKKYHVDSIVGICKARTDLTDRLKKFMDANKNLMNAGYSLQINLLNQIKTRQDLLINEIKNFTEIEGKEFNLRFIDQMTSLLNTLCIQLEGHIKRKNNTISNLEDLNKVLVIPGK